MAVFIVVTRRLVSLEFVSLLLLVHKVLSMEAVEALDEESQHDHYVRDIEDEDVDGNMMDSLFELSSYVSYNENKNDDESDDENNVCPTRPLGGEEE